MPYDFFVHASLCVPNGRGSPQLLLEQIEGVPLLTYILRRLRGYAALGPVHVVCSAESADDPIATLVTKLAEESASVPLALMRLSTNEPGAFIPDNQVVSKQQPFKFTRVMGLFDTEQFFQIRDRLQFQNAILAWAETLAHFQPSRLRKALLCSSGHFHIIHSGPEDLTMIITSARHAEDRYQEIKSELVQERFRRRDWLASLNEGQTAGEKQIRQEQQKALRTREQFPLPLHALHNNASGNLWQWFDPDQQEGPLLNPLFPCCRNEELFILNSTLPTLAAYDQTLSSPNLIEEFFSPELQALSKNWQENLDPILQKHLQECASLKILCSPKDSAPDLQVLLRPLTAPPRLLTLDCQNYTAFPDSLMETIKQASELGVSACFLRCGLILPDTTRLLKMTQAGLNGVIISSDLSDEKKTISTLESWLEKIREVSESPPLIYLEIPFSLSRHLTIESLHARFLYRLTGIIVLPARKPSPQFHLDTPPLNPALPCQFTWNTLTLNASGELLLCEWNPENPLPFNEEGFAEHRERIGTDKFCEECPVKNRSGGFGGAAISPPLFLGPPPKEQSLQGLYLPFLEEILQRTVREDTLTKAVQLLKVLLQESMTPHPDITLQVIDACILKEEVDTALDFLESILKSNPTHEDAWSRINQLEQKYS